MEDWATADTKQIEIKLSTSYLERRNSWLWRFLNKILLFSISKGEKNWAAPSFWPQETRVISKQNTFLLLLFWNILRECKAFPETLNQFRKSVLAFFESFCVFSFFLIRTALSKTLRKSRRLSQSLKNFAPKTPTNWTGNFSIPEKSAQVLPSLTYRLKNPSFTSSKTTSPSATLPATSWTSNVSRPTNKTQNDGGQNRHEPWWHHQEEQGRQAGWTRRRSRPRGCPWWRPWSPTILLWWTGWSPANSRPWRWSWRRSS